MTENYHKSATTQGPHFLGAPKPAVENQQPSAPCEGDTRVTGETTPVERHSWDIRKARCPGCGETLRLIRVFPSGRGFEMRCDGTDSNPHRAQLFITRLQKGEALRILGGALYKC